MFIYVTESTKMIRYNCIRQLYILLRWNLCKTENHFRFRQIGVNCVWCHSFIDSVKRKKNIYIIWTFVIDFKWYLPFLQDTDYEDPGASLHHRIISRNCSFDSLFQKENPCSSKRIYSVCSLPNTNSIRRCYFLPFETALNSSTMVRKIISKYW